jgi:hypothetical protein
MDREHPFADDLAVTVGALLRRGQRVGLVREHPLRQAEDVGDVDRDRRPEHDRERQVEHLPSLEETVVALLLRLAVAVPVATVRELPQLLPRCLLVGRQRAGLLVELRGRHRPREAELDQPAKLGRGAGRGHLDLDLDPFQT